MRIVVLALIVLLMVVHQDFWWWDDNTLVFGFMPIGLAYHMFISIAAAAVWFLAVKFCWPEELEVLEPEAPAASSTQAPPQDVTRPATPSTPKEEDR